MPEIKALGKGSIASALSVLMRVITVLGWIGFIGSAVVLAAFIAIDLSGGEFKGTGIEVYRISAACNLSRRVRNTVCNFYRIYPHGGAVAANSADPHRWRPVRT